MDSGSPAINSTSAWQCDGLIFSFEPQTTSRAPRAWDREPKASFAPTHKGRIVWKRYGLRSAEVGNVRSAPLELGLSEAAICPRDVKRLCLKPTSGFQPLVQARKHTQYFATLQDKALGTPRRKATEQNSLRPKTLDGGVPAINNINSSLVLNEGKVAESQKQEEDVREDMAETDSNHETQQLCLLHHFRHDNHNAVAANSVDVKCLVEVRPLENEIVTQTPEEQSVRFAAPIDIPILVERPSNRQLLQQTNPSSDELTELEGITIDALAVSVERICPSASSNLLAGHIVGTANQISVVSLEDERDKLSGILAQPREVLLLEEPESTITVPVLRDHIPENALGTSDTILPRAPSNVFDQSSDISGNAGAVIEYLEEPLQPTAKPFGLINLSIMDRSRGESEALDPITLQLTSQEKISPVVQGDASEGLENARGAESMSPDIHTSLPMRRTRSGARFSDDTNMLKDFLNRAHAKKAAESKEIAVISYGSQSPRRSPRKILGQLDRNSPSPTKSRDPIRRHNAPSGDDSLDLLNSGHDNDELCGKAKLRRRSARTCTTMLEKTTLGPLCFIPVRRPDGSEPVVLQKSAAQELAITTRANTRCNKGSSKVPKLTLETLATQVVEDAPVRKHEIRSTKSVDWDKHLVYFQRSVDRKVGKEVKEGKAARSKVKRLKEQEAASGTQAPKSVVDKANPSNVTPAPRRRAKRKS
ncbi:hypothetical protein MMC18_003949 [Xylographa bjoerkii]|nr:hypothetical protein [Xylographa bjoerkii]